MDKSDSALYLSQLISELPRDLGRTIIQEIYIKEKTEAQIAKELNISQQAVNKCKIKMLKHLSQIISS